MLAIFLRSPRQVGSPAEVDTPAPATKVHGRLASNLARARKLLTLSELRSANLGGGYARGLIVL